MRVCVKRKDNNANASECWQLVSRVKARENSPCHSSHCLHGCGMELTLRKKSWAIIFRHVRVRVWAQQLSAEPLRPPAHKGLGMNWPETTWWGWEVGGSDSTANWASAGSTPSPNQNFGPNAPRQSESVSPPRNAAVRTLWFSPGESTPPPVEAPASSRAAKTRKEILGHWSFWRHRHSSWQSRTWNCNDVSVFNCTQPKQPSGALSHNSRHKHSARAHCSHEC